jgi:hypothetical protein
MYQKATSRLQNSKLLEYHNRHLLGGVEIPAVKRQRSMLTAMASVASVRNILSSWSFASNGR